MIDRGKRNLLGVQVDTLDYEAAAQRVLEAAEEPRSYSCTALAVHGVITGVTDAEQRHRINRLDLVTPDGQPVRWALNLLYRVGLPDRVYGPNLMLALCERAAEAGLPIYLYGSAPETVGRLHGSLRGRFEGLRIAGAEPSRFRRLTSDERGALIERVRNSGARILFVGLGCPRQEVFAYEMAAGLGIPVLAVGAAFDYHAGLRQEPPQWLQRLGLQWAHRLAQDPGRLWKRYLGSNLLFVALLTLQLARIWRPSTGGRAPASELMYG